MTVLIFCINGMFLIFQTLADNLILFIIIMILFMLTMIIVIFDSKSGCLVYQSTFVQRQTFSHISSHSYMFTCEKVPEAR